MLLRKVKHRVGVIFLKAETEQVVAFEKRALPESRFAPAVCLFCRLVSPHLHISSLIRQFCRRAKICERTHSEGIVITSLALCVIRYESFSILMRITYMNVCVRVSITLLCVFIFCSALMFSSVFACMSWKSGVHILPCRKIPQC